MDTKKKRRVVITGLGTVNPTGNTVAESWAELLRLAAAPLGRSPLLMRPILR